MLDDTQLGNTVQNQENINLLELIEDTIKTYGSNNKFKYAIAENFECHKYTRIDFSENMTVFVGESSNGKSSFMRMLNWVQYNEPRGDKHITTGERECRGTIGTFNGFIVKREITPSYNRYYITHESWDQDYVLEGFGVNVPYEVQLVLGAFKVKIDDKRQNDLKLNYLEQGQGWFLISDQYPSTTKAKAVGLLYGVHYLDQAIRDTKYELDKVNRRISSTENEIEQLREKAKAYDYLDDLKAKIDLVEKAYNDGVRLKNLSDKLMELNVKYAKATNDYNEAIKLLGRIDEDRLQEAETLISVIEDKLTKLNTLSTLSKDYKFSLSEIVTNKSIIERGTISNDAETLVKEIEQDIKKLKNLSKLNSSYINTKEIIKNSEKVIALDSNLKKAEIISSAAEKSLRKGAKLINISIELSDKQDKLDWCNKVIDNGKYITIADETAKHIANEIAKVKKLKSLAIPYRMVLEGLEKVEDTLTKARDIDIAEERFNNAYGLFKRSKRLIPFSSKYKEVLGQLESLKPELEQESKLKKLDSLLDRIKNIFARHEVLLKLRFDLMKENSSIENENVLITRKQKELEDLINKYESIIRELGVCPLCRSEITEDVVGHLMMDLKK